MLQIAVGLVFLFIFIGREGGKGDVVFAGLYPELVVFLRDEVLVLHVTVAYHHQSGCLYSAQREHATSGRKAQGLGGIDAHEPVGFAASLGTAVKIVILSAVFQVIQPLTDGFVGQAADPKTGKGLLQPR